MADRHVNNRALLLSIPAGLWAVAICCAAPPEDAGASDAAFSSWRIYTSRDGLPDDDIQALCVDGERVWVGTGRGLGLIETGACRAWTDFDPGGGVHRWVVSAIDVDRTTRDVWLGTWGRGLIRFSAGRFDRFDQFNSGLAGDLVFALTVAGGKLWVATNGGISSFDPLSHRWDLFEERRADRVAVAFTGMCSIRGGADVFAAGWPGKVRCIDAEREKVAVVTSIPAMTAVDRAGDTLWGAEPGRLYRRRRGADWEGRAIPSPASGGVLVRCVAGRDDSECWLGTDQGLYALTDWNSGAWVSYRNLDASTQTLRAIHRDGMVSATRRVEVGLPDNRIRCIAFQGGTVWVGTPNGLARGMNIDRSSPLRAEASQGDRADAVDGSGHRAQHAQMAPHEAALTGPVAIGALSPAGRLMVLPGQSAEGASGVPRVDVPAIQLAVAQANERGGYRGMVSFEAAIDIHGYARYGWNMPEDSFIALAHDRGVVGMVGHFAPTSHVACAVAQRTEVPVVNAATSPPAVDEVANPWIFRCPKVGTQRCESAIGYLFDQLGFTRLVALQPSAGPGKPYLEALRRCAQERGHPFRADIALDPKKDDVGPVIEAIADFKADAVVSSHEARAAATLLRTMRQAGLTQVFVGDESIVTSEFIKLAGERPGEVLAVWHCRDGDDRIAREAFSADYYGMFKRRPAPEAFASFNAANHLLRAIDLAGLERDAVRTMLQDMTVSSVARLRDGHWSLLAPAETTSGAAAGR